MTDIGRNTAFTETILISSDAAALAGSYTAGLGASREDERPLDPARAVALGVPHAQGRVHRVLLGQHAVSIVEFRGLRGRPYPRHSSASDLWFQHLALVVDDIGQVHEQLLRTDRFTPISRGGPVRLPPTSGGVTAFKFRDPEGHPLELLQFPSGAAPRQWRRTTGTSGPAVLG